VEIFSFAEHVKNAGDTRGVEGAGEGEMVTDVGWMGWSER
jgi:hypothetical protein